MLMFAVGSDSVKSKPVASRNGGARVRGRGMQGHVPDGFSQLSTELSESDSPFRSASGVKPRCS
jgi:hypothetical protein